MASPSITFSYVYIIYFDSNTNAYTVSSGDITDTSNITIFDDRIYPSTDDPNILGDVSYDQFSFTISGGSQNLTGSATYIGQGSSPADQSSGIIVQQGHDTYFYYTNNPVNVGTTLTFLDQPETICFMSGTMIRTPEGDVPVEVLKRGDLVTTTDGRAMPVTWVGRQTVSRIFADPLRVLPIRIKAGAFADNVPSRDLLLSPDHAVLVDGALIQTGALVNGASIVRETRVPTIFTYYHVELDDHSLILAENTPAETFVDNVDRLNFDNWAEYQALYPEGKSVEELPYPRAKARRQVPVATRVKLGERAQVIRASVGVAAA